MGEEVSYPLGVEEIPSVEEHLQGEYFLQQLVFEQAETYSSEAVLPWVVGWQSLEVELTWAGHLQTADEDDP